MAVQGPPSRDTYVAVVIILLAAPIHGITWQAWLYNPRPSIDVTPKSGGYQLTSSMREAHDPVSKRSDFVVKLPVSDSK